MDVALWFIAVNCVNEDDERKQERERQERRKIGIIRKPLRDTSNPFDLSETQFRFLYRLSRQATRILCENLRQWVQPGIRSTAIPTELKILAVLNFMASGSYQRRVGQDFLTCMSQSVFSGILHLVVTALNNHMPEWIKYSTERQEIEIIKRQYWDNARFPGVTGAIDGTHIAIWPPQKEREHLFINRKLYHSLNVMLVSDYFGKILYVSTAHGGRTHDARVWASSALSVHLEERFWNGETGTWLLGDSGYPTLPYLMTPKLNQEPATPSALYTEAHVKARCSVERCIGVLKGRWRCLRKERALHYKPEFAALIVNAVCVLHNYAKHFNVPDPDIFLDDIDIEDEVPREENAHLTGNEVRENIIRRYFTQ
ncbi:putative nuclease HARBI1 [Linepithema humile]|uniref:putative nuclease HARBI1 n=1 Tax=Linepithema humile TaxID=83485 RepID=UPI00351DC410